MVAETIISHLAENGVSPSSLKRLWLHQANINMNDLIAPARTWTRPCGRRVPKYPGRICQHEFPPARLSHFISLATISPTTILVFCARSGRDIRSAA